MKLKILLIRIWEKSLSFKEMACSVSELGAIYWAGGGNRYEQVKQGASFDLPVYECISGKGNRRKACIC